MCFLSSLRTGELLNLRSEKIDKLVVDNAIQESLAGWTGATLVEWTCAESPLLYDDTDGMSKRLDRFRCRCIIRCLPM